MYIKREYIPGLHMFIYTYDNKKEAEEMEKLTKHYGGFAKMEQDEISNTWKIKIW